MQAKPLFDCFYFGDYFEYAQITEYLKTIQVGNHCISYEDNLLLCDQKFYHAMENKEHLRVMDHEKIKVYAINLPKQSMHISNHKYASIIINTSSNIYITKKDSELLLSLYPNESDIYFNGSLIQCAKECPFNVGDILVIHHVIIVRKEHQLQIIPIQEAIDFHDTHISLEPIQEDYPIEFPTFHRSPRIYLKASEESIDIRQPINKEEVGRNELLRTIVPPLGMVVLSGLTSFLTGGSPLMMLGMGGASLITAGFSISSHFTNKSEVRHHNEVRDNKYRSYVIQQKAYIESLKNNELMSLEYMYPSVEDLALMIKEYHSRIYERMRKHRDFLEVRLGTGNISPKFTVSFDNNNDIEDELIDLAEEQLVSPYYVLEQAPIVISTINQTIGLAGQYTELRTSIQTLLFQMAALQSYHDVEFLLLTSNKDYEEHWKEWRWLPHLKLNDLNLRGIVHDPQSRDMVLNSFYQIITKRKQQLSEEKNEDITFSPHYVLTILDEEWLVGHGLNEYLAEDMSQYGVTVIWAKETINMLPETVTTLIEYHSSEAATLINNNQEYVNQLFVPNHLPQTFSIEDAIYRLANLEHVEVEKNAIPEKINFLELYNVKTVDELNFEERWKKANTSKSLAVPLGLRGKDDIVYLNLHERAHGPHGLVAGTTGSGKSEIVQSYILSLAVNFAPEDIGFLPIDFKGGGMANLFKNLPHLLGSITNLDGAASARALQSIRAELQKRQRYFGEYGVNHINDYTKLYKKGKEEQDPKEKAKYPSEPLPHLFLISDEFAELKANEPEFMAELVSTARIGRSLGVHLILATQKPSGVVDDQIWSNSRFKLALKVADTNDSQEIIKTPDAATITQPGRAYLQVGNNEIYELFQSAYSGGNYTPNAVHEEKIDERIWVINEMGQCDLLTEDLSEESETIVVDEEKSELDAIVEAIAEYADSIDTPIPEKPWLPPLETEIISPLLEKHWKEKRCLSIPFGYLDLPAKQKQENYNVDLETLSHIALYGSPGQGKSTALQTLVLNLARLNTPEQVQFNLLDFGTNGLLPLKDLPHVVDIVRLDEEEKLEKYLKRIRRDIQQRKDLFTEVGVASLSQYEEKTGETLPVLITFIDTYDSIRECKLEDDIESVVNQVLRDGASVGMYMIMTALRTNTFRMNMLSNIPTQMGLYLVEENAIRDIVGQEALIAQDIVGRAQIVLDHPQEIQIYLPTQGESDIERLHNMDDEINQMNKEWKGECPQCIPMLPNEVSEIFFYQSPIVLDMLKQGSIPIALSKDTTDPVGFVPHRDGYFVIGHETPQQEEYIQRAILKGFSLLDGIAQRVVFNANDQFELTNSSFDMVIDEMEYSTIIVQLKEELENRLSMETDSQPIYIYIPNTQNFAEKSFISSEDLDIFLRKGSKANMFFIFQGNQNNIENGFEDFNQKIRNSIPAGMYGTRTVDQNMVTTKSNYNEPIVAIDEASFFESRETCRVKLISEWGV